MLYASGMSQGISGTACDAVFAAIDITRRHGFSVACATHYRFKLRPPARVAAVMHAAMGSVVYAMPGFNDVRPLTGLTKSAMRTSRTQVNRLLDPTNTSVALHTLYRAADVLGKRVRIELVDA